MRRSRSPKITPSSSGWWPPKSSAAMASDEMTAPGSTAPRRTSASAKVLLPSPGAVGEDPTRHRVGVVVPDVDHDVEPQAAVRGDSLVHGAVQDHHEGLEVGAFSPRPQSNPRLVTVGGHRLEAIVPEIHPHAVERVLDHGGDAGLPRSRRAIQHHDLAWRTYVCHASPPLDPQTAYGG